MSRRVATMTLTAVLLIALVAVAWLVPVPFAAMSPGPTENTLGTVDGKPIVQISGHETFKTNGALDLTTVAVSSPDQKLDLISVIVGWIDPRVAVVPYDYLYPGDPTPEQVEQENAEAMQTSQQTAVAAALRQANEKVTPVVQVQAVVEDTPAVGRLKAGDVIVAVDGKHVTGAQDVVDIVGRHQPGDRIQFAVRRGDKDVDVSITTAKSPQDPGKAFVGITPFDGFEFPFKVTVNLGQDIGGPSAGTMFALAIVDKLTKGSLTGGHHIAGTGAIAADGTVQPIGGIQQKIAGAKENGAETFLVPAANCEAAAAAQVDGIRLVRVDTLRGAVQSLERLRDQPSARVPSCAR
ncbi:PDZ domain-containing protein [Actinopolymorpha sp. B11F2]|uniref:YlbL family protein n=1 Tax=Actinopolymorpha sp. B11F2 TaxID=3160862 RepID=UPI0032E4F9A0